MPNGKLPRTQLAFALVLATLGVACSRTALPLPMLACAAHSPAHASTGHAIKPGGERAAAADKSAAHAAVARHP
jgi:hypothetical protein